MRSRHERGGIGAGRAGSAFGALWAVALAMGCSREPASPPSTCGPALDERMPTLEEVAFPLDACTVAANTILQHCGAELRSDWVTSYLLLRPPRPRDSPFVRAELGYASERDVLWASICPRLDRKAIYSDRYTAAERGPALYDGCDLASAGFPERRPFEHVRITPAWVATIGALRRVGVSESTSARYGEALLLCEEEIDAAIVAGWSLPHGEPGYVEFREWIYHGSSLPLGFDILSAEEFGYAAPASTTLADVTPTWDRAASTSVEIALLTRTEARYQPFGQLVFRYHSERPYSPPAAIFDGDLATVEAIESVEGEGRWLELVMAPSVTLGELADAVSALQRKGHSVTVSCRWDWDDQHEERGGVPPH